MVAASLMFREAILKGWQSYSPGLRGTSYPGLAIKGFNPVRVEFLLNFPKVGATAPTLGYKIRTPLGLLHK